MNRFGRSFLKTHVILIILCLLSLSLRLWLIDKRWVNVDEGAHLMDAALVLDGSIPLVDFDSRQPLYVYVLAGFLKLFGTNYNAGRLYAVTFSLLTGVIVFLLAKALFDEQVGLLSAATYWMLPLELLQSTLVKTEPLATFLTCVCFYTVVKFSRFPSKSWLITGGAIAAMAFYVRQSSLAIPPTVLIFLLVIHQGRVWQAAKHFGSFLVGYLAVLVLVMGYYSWYMSSSLLLMGGVLPFGFLLLSLGPLVDLHGASDASVNALPLAYGPYESFDVYFQYLKDVVNLHSFLLLGLLFSAVTFLHHSIHKGQEGGTTHRAAPVLLYGWVSFLLLAYCYRSLTQAFYIDYFREFLPPLVIIFAAWVCSSIPSLAKERRIENLILVGVSMSAVLFVFQSHYKDQFGIGQHASLTIALFALLYFAGKWQSATRRVVFVSVLVGLLASAVVGRYEPFKPYFSGVVPSVIMIVVIYALTWILLEKITRPSFVSYGKFVASSIMLASFVVSVSYSATILTTRYDNAWSPEVVETIAAYLREHTNNQDEVLSGAMIWEFQALRKPYQMISHPLSFGRGFSEEERLSVKAASELRPPKVIILDGYTEMIFMRNLPFLRELLQTRYHFVFEAGPKVFPVKIYQLKEGLPIQQLMDQAGLTRADR